MALAPQEEEREERQKARKKREHERRDSASSLSLSLLSFHCLPSQTHTHTNTIPYRHDHHHHRDRRSPSLLLPASDCRGAGCCCCCRRCSCCCSNSSSLSLAVVFSLLSPLDSAAAAGVPLSLTACLPLSLLLSPSIILSSVFFVLRTRVRTHAQRHALMSVCVCIERYIFSTAFLLLSLHSLLILRLRFLFSSRSPLPFSLLSHSLTRLPIVHTCCQLVQHGTFLLFLPLFFIFIDIRLVALSFLRRSLSPSLTRCRFARIALSCRCLPSTQYSLPFPFKFLFVSHFPPPVPLLLLLLFARSSSPDLISLPEAASFTHSSRPHMFTPRLSPYRPLDQSPSLE